MIAFNRIGAGAFLFRPLPRRATLLPTTTMVDVNGATNEGSFSAEDLGYWTSRTSCCGNRSRAGGAFNIPYFQGVADFANVFASKPVVTLTVESSDPEHLISARLEFVDSKRFGFRLWRDTPGNPWTAPVIVHWHAIDVIAFVRDL